MCGIAGIFDLHGHRDVDRDALARMSLAIKHRGPDGDGTFFAPGVGLTHRRLAIIDFKGGHQPFEVQSKQSVLTYNGEIYNFEELSKSLTAESVNISTRSDTEILAEGFDKFGTSFISKLRGMFAFAVWSTTNNSLTLVRDRLGERPLYYGVTENGFLVFASEMSAIVASNLFNLSICPKATTDYFHLGYVPDPSSIYIGIKKLLPGSYLVANKNVEPKLTKYWSPNFDQPYHENFEQAQDKLRALLDEAVKLQLMSDVPLGAFLSGGVDSSAIVASMAQSSSKILSCSIGFEEESHDEREYAREIANQYNTDHREEVSSSSSLENLDRIARAFGEPFADTSAVPMFNVCKLARQHVTVALSGDGGDEVFAGYRRYPFFISEEKIRASLPLGLRKNLFGTLGALYPKLDWAPRPLRFKTTFQSLGDTTPTAYLRTVGINLPDRVSSMLSDDLRSTFRPEELLGNFFSDVSDLDALSQAQYVDQQTWLPARMLTKVDRMSMAHSLEVRPPLLDHKLVEWANRLPADFKLGRGLNGSLTGKRILKAAHEDRLSHNVLYRKKQGFDLPVSGWLKRKDGPLENLLSSNLWRTNGMLNVAAIEKMADSHLKGRQNFSQELWSVIMFDAFLGQQN